MHSLEMLPRKEHGFHFVQKTTIRFGWDSLGKELWTFLLRLDQEF
jgi:hypothetical protein